jgi:hypothetical protein
MKSTIDLIGPIRNTLAIIRIKLVRVFFGATIARISGHGDRGISCVRSELAERLRILSEDAIQVARRNRHWAKSNLALLLLQAASAASRP